MNPLEAAKILSTALKLTESQTKKEFENVREEAKLRSDELRKELKTLEHSFDLVEGEQGPAGPMGPSGERGYIGQKGEKGDQGIHGERGLQGERGEKGDQGILRIPGDIGPKGDTGVEGDQGIQGEKGEKGDQGVQGIRGEKGIQGDKGDRGIQGDKGVQGISGKDGTDGLPGDNGLNGDVGPKGERGSQGIQGQKGDQGLTGDKGDNGDRGNPGTDSDIVPFQTKFEELSKNIDTRISKLAYGVAIGGHSAGSGEVNLRSLDDVDYNSVSAPTAGHVLIYNGTLGKWQSNDTFITTVNTRSLIPTSNVTFNLGSTTKRYKDIFLANSTIHLGTAQISATGSKILFNNEAAVSNSYLQATFATSASVTTQVNNLIDQAPGALNTLNELAAALNDDAEFSSTITNSLAAKATTASLTSTNTAIRLLVSDRLQVANAAAIYATKSNPTTSGLLAHTGRATISTNLAVSGNTTISGLIANGTIGTSNYVLRTNGTSAFWAPGGGGGGSTDKYIEVANANALYATKAYAAANSYVKNILANTNTFIATKITGAITAYVGNTAAVTTVASSVELDDAVVVNPAGHLTIVISGTTYKIPYFS